ncbi:hypothetical protein Hdeb2414_s0008g00291241 [Helianthus debilis subsp. tardiflorus]
MSDKWPEDSESVPVLLFDGQEATLYQSAFPTFTGVMGTRPLRDGEEFWQEQIRRNFMYAWLEAFVAAPLATEGARIPNPRPCRAITSVGKRLSIFPVSSVLHNLGVDPDEKKPKRVSKKKAATAGGATVKKTEVTDATSDAGSHKGITCFIQINLEDFVMVVDSLEDLHVIGGKPQHGMMATSRGSGSAVSKGLDSGVTPLSDHEEEAGVDPEAEKLIRKNALKMSRAETKPESSPIAKKVVVGKPAIGKKGDPRDLYTEVSPNLEEACCATKTYSTSPNIAAEEKEAESSKAEKRPVDITPEIEKAPEVLKITGLDVRVENPIAQQAPPIQTENIASTAGDATGDTREEKHVGAQHVAGKGAGGSGVDTRKGLQGRNHGKRRRFVPKIRWAIFIIRHMAIVALTSSTSLCGI